MRIVDSLTTQLPILVLWLLLQEVLEEVIVPNQDLQQLRFPTGELNSITLISSNAFSPYYSTFIGNNGEKTPAFGTLYIPVSFLGHNIFDSNIGGAIQVQ